MPTAPRAAQPTKEIFDPFNSSATGHQRAENRLSGSTLWRDSRHTKLREQFGSGAGGGKRVADSVGAGADGSMKKRMGLKGNGTVTWRRERGQLRLRESLRVGKRVDDDAGDGNDKEQRERKRARLAVGNGSRVAKHVDLPTFNAHDKNEPEQCDSSPSNLLSPIDPNSSGTNTSPTSQKGDDCTKTLRQEEDDQPNLAASKPIFENLNFYINGSTAPFVSDHKLKRLITEHGGNMSIALGRHTVTHVILGRPGSANGSSGGGRLAGSKIQKEITSKRGESVKYVTAEWVLESISANKRLPEARFEALRFAAKGMGSVKTMFGAMSGRRETEGKGSGNGAG